MRFALIKGQSQYGSLRLHVDQLAEALGALGHAASIIDLTASSATEQLQRTLSQALDCLIGFNGVGAEIASPGRFTPSPGFIFAALFVDHPLHHLERLASWPSGHAVFFLDQSHVEFMRRWSRPGDFAHIGFLPPGANTLEGPVDTGDAAFGAREIKLLFTGTYRGPPERPWADWPDSPARTLISQVAERMLAHGRTSILEAVTASLDEAGAALTPQLLRDTAPLLAMVQAYAEAALRHRLLAELGQAGVEMEVRGLGWEPLCRAYRSFRYGGVGSFEETLGLLRRTRMVLNINNGFVSGGHERVFTALIAGCAVVSEASGYYDRAFNVNELATYDIGRPAEAVVHIDRLNADPAAQARLARAGRARALADHSWSSRVTPFIEALNGVS